MSCGAVPQTGETERSPHGTKTPRSTGPPIIRESFTLRCPKNPQSTSELAGCGAKQVARTNEVINRLARQIFRQLPGRGRRAFIAAERSWLVYRNSICKARSSVYDGGTAVPVVFFDCAIHLNETHIEELSWIEEANRHFP